MMSRHEKDLQAQETHFDASIPTGDIPIQAYKLSGRDFLKLAGAGAAGAILASCLPTSVLAPGTGEPTEIPPTATSPINIPGTEVAPSQTPEGEIVTSQVYMSQEEVLGMDPIIEALFTQFQEQIKATKPDATFSVWGALATTQSGQRFFTPFFEVSEGGVLTQEYVVRARTDGTALVTLRLQQRIVEGDDGQEYYTLSQVNDSDTLEAIPPIPLIYIGIPKVDFDQLSPEEQANAVVYFNAFGGILEDFSPSKGTFAQESVKRRMKDVVTATYQILHETCYYGTEEIESYQKISLEIIQINGEDYQAIVGVSQEGEVTTLAALMTTYSGEKVWTRISVTDLGGDNGQMVIWLNPDQDGAIQVNDQTAEIFMNRFFKVIGDGGQQDSINNIQDGKITLEVPYAYYESGGPDIKWVEETLNLQDIEIRIFQSPQEWQEFAQNYPEYAVKVFSSSYGRSGVGATLVPKTDGGTLLLIPYTSWDSIFADVWSEKRQAVGVNNIDEGRSSIEVDGFAPWFFNSLTTFANRPEGKLAFTTNYLIKAKYPISEVLGSFDYIPQGFVETKGFSIP